MTPARRIVLLSSLPPPSGGISTWTEILLRRGLPGGFRVDLVNTALPADPARRSPLGSAQLRRGLRILRDLDRALRAGPTTAVHVNIAPLATGVARDWLAVRRIRAAGVAVVLHHHGLTSRLADETTGRWRLRAVRAMARAAAANLVMNEPDRAFVTQLAGTPAVSIPNFFDETTFPEPEPMPRAPERTRRVAFVGLLNRAKGAGRVLEVARARPGLAFDLYGPSTPELDAELRALPANVTWHGEVAHDAVLAALRRADLFLFPTTHAEGFPYGVLEAMALALPVVTTRVAALPEMVEEGKGGFLVDPETAALLHAIDALLGDEAARAAMGRFNRERAFARWSYPMVAARLAEIYAGLETA